jgi:hypothetical protein
MKPYLKKGATLQFIKGVMGGAPRKKIASVFEDGVNRYISFDDDTVMVEETLATLWNKGLVVIYSFKIDKEKPNG